MNFEGQPKILFSSIIEVYTDEEDGAWYGYDADGVPTQYSDEEIASAIPVGTNHFVVLDPLRIDDPQRFALDPETGLIHVETGGHPLSLEEFRKISVRADDEGMPIIPMCLPIFEQYRVCKETGNEGHLDSIAAAAAYIHGQDSNNFESSMYYQMSADLDDGMSEDEIQARLEDPAAPSYETLGLSEIIDAPWCEIREFPQYQMAPVRTMFGRFLNDRIGEFPLEKIARLHVHPDAPIEDVLAEHAKLVRIDPPFDGGGIVPGYTTSRVSCYQHDNFEAIVFSDMRGKYVYAWPAPPTLDNEPSSPRI